MRLRRLPPVRSPLPGAALVAGVRAALVGAAARPGQRFPELRDRLLELFGSRSLLFVDSGTSALALAMGAGSSHKRKLVAIPAYACFDIATAVDTAAVDFIPYDIDPTTLGPSWPSLRHALDSGADSVVVVHLYGIPVDMHAVRTLLKEFSAICIEDTAQGAGAWFDDRRLGSFGSLSVLSFGRGKGITGGSGGALLANDDKGVDLLQKIRSSVRDHANSALPEFLKLLAQYLLARPSVYGIPASLPFLGLGETPYHKPHAPQWASSLALGVLSRTIETIDVEAQLRRSNAERLVNAVVSKESIVTPPSLATPGFLRLPLVLRSGNSGLRSDREAGYCGVMPGYPTALVDLPGFGGRANAAAEVGAARTFEGARRLANELATLPVHGGLTQRDLARVEAWLTRPG